MNRTRLGLVALSCGALAVSVLAAPAVARSDLHLPTREDASTYAPGAETILYGANGIETQIPGRAEDRERVTISLGGDGSTQAIVVDQRLTLHGLGDFFFKVSGPAQDVEALPASEAKPGLRKGSVLWQGFSDGRKVLAARMPLFPDQEKDRLPLETSMSLENGGRRLQPGDTASGDFRLHFSVSNSTSSLTSMSVAEGDKRELAGVLDAIRRSLEKGKRPAPGKGGIPKNVTALGPIKPIARFLELPFEVRGQFVFPSDTAGIHATGGRVVERPDGIHVRFGGTLGAGRPRTLDLVVTGRAEQMPFPALHMEAGSGLLAPAQLRPPAGKSWSDALAARPGAFSGREMLTRVMTVLSQMAKLTRLDSYLGNPDVSGQSVSRYIYRIAPPPQVAQGPVVEVTQNVNLWLAILAVLALVFLAFDLLLLWSLS
ncbi:MAG: hypothetical protein QOH90_747 [Actinomycetota bacterium]|nr:hypothetical protein [Actinomycetota bacterium]